MASSSDIPDVVEIDQLVIHGNPTRAKQLGYNSPVGGVEDDVASYIDKAYDPSVITGHSTGNPSFCMHLKLDNFFRTYDGSVGFTVEQAYLLQFPLSSSLYNSSYTSVTLGSVVPPEYGGSIIVNGVERNYNLLNYAVTVFRPEGTFTVSAVILHGSKRLNEVQLFTFDPSDTGSGIKGRWADQKNSGPARLASPITLTGMVPQDTDEPVIFGIIVLSGCSCNQGDKNRPVFAMNISKYIPDVPGYVWRRFGTYSQELALASKNGYTFPDSMKDLCDENWHLIRPFYYVCGTKEWEDVEAEDPRLN